jgi:RNA polymerase sigma-70 factor, ECF subfamily
MSQPVLQRIANGDQAAMSECIEGFGPLVWALARRLSRTPADAEDATQDIFLDIWRSAGRFNAASGSEKLFIAMIARRRLIDRLRKLKSDPISLGDTDVESEVGGHSRDLAPDCAEAEIASRALAQLKPEQRQCLELGLIQGLSQAQIAEQLQLPLGTVKTFMRRGLIKIRELMNLQPEDLAAESSP